MKSLSCLVFASGSGTNFNAIINSIKNDLFHLEIKSLFVNKECGAIKYAEDNFIPINKFNLQNFSSRDEFDQELSKYVLEYNPDFIVLAGWMHILGKSFLNNVKHIPVLNLHPALPNSFVGANCIEDAYKAFLQKKITHTGCMTHYTIEELDRGETLSFCKIPIYESDTLDDLKDRFKKLEKGVLLEGIQKIISKLLEKETNKLENGEKVKSGKVKMYQDIGCDKMCFLYSKRQSAFDQYICDIPKKDIVLNYLNKWWMNQTTHIIPNHFVHCDDHMMITEKCTPIMIEVIVRSYMTGSTSTSIWTHYKNGSRTIYGIDFPDGLEKNQKLDRLIITPTTKGVVDKPITPEEIVSEKYMTQEEWNYVSEKALELFQYGEMVANRNGLILVDTKYEFGKNSKGEILLIDELHTCDSSRFWIKDTYDKLFSEGSEPQKLDKDSIRDYVKSVCDPYKDSIPNIPFEYIQRTSNTYCNLYQKLVGKSIEEEYSNKYSNLDNDTAFEEYIDNYFKNHHKNKVIILYGSEKDSKHVNKIRSFCDQEGLYCEHYCASAHKKTKQLLKILDKAEESDDRIVWITVAGRSNALSGVVGAQSKYPVIACPPFGDKTDMTVNVHSSLQCPSYVPVATILEPLNAILTVKKIFNMI
jgi:phosphoribosylaminoimidazole-succinocarboxamide synthase